METTPEEYLIYLANKRAKDLLTKLELKTQRVLDKYSYYNADNDISDFGISIPKIEVNIWKSEQDREVFLYAKLKNRGT